MKPIDYRRIFWLIGCMLVLALQALAVIPAAGQEIVVLWQQNREADLGGYKIYYGRSPRHYEDHIDVGNMTEYAVRTLPDTGMYYFAMSAYDINGNESHLSREIPFHVDSYALLNLRFSLMPNYPNPLNPETRIPYFVPRRTLVTIAIHNLLGRQVKTLVMEEKEYGTYEVVWDGTDENGNPVANGVYFYRMIVGSLCQTRKLTLLR